MFTEMESIIDCLVRVSWNEFVQEDLSPVPKETLHACHVGDYDETSYRNPAVCCAQSPHSGMHAINHTLG